MKEIIEYYTIQHRKVSESPWREPDGKLSPPENGISDWSFSSFDHFGRAFDPWAGRGNAYRPTRPTAHADLWALWCSTGRSGWTNKRFAQFALAAARRMDSAGDWDSFDTYRKRMQSVRHQFRIVRCYYHSSWEPLEVSQ